MTGENALPEKQAKRGEELRQRLASARSLIYTDKGAGGQVVKVEEPKEAAALVNQLRRIVVPAREQKAKKESRTVEVTTKDGKSFIITYLKPAPDNKLDGAGPLVCDRVDVSGFGQAWIDNQWKYRFRDLAFKRELEAKQRRDEETAKVVGRDLPTFLKHIVSVSAHYREGES